MRPDVKLGVVISMVFVLVAGTYYLYRDRRESPIPLATGPEASSQPAAVDQLADSAPVRTPTRRQPSAARKTRDSEATRPRDGQLAEGESPALVRPGAKLPVNQTPERTADARSIDTTRPAAASGTDRPQDRTRPARQTVPTDAEAVAQAGEITQEPGPPSVQPAPVSRQRPTPLVATRRPSQATAERPEATSDEAAIETHRVQSGDTLSSLAERYYGSTRHTRFLAEVNPHIRDPNVLRIGTVVKIVPLPADGTTARPRTTPSTGAVTASGRRTYRVEAGDSFYSIARDVLGDAKRWQELLELNKDAVGGDPTHLQIGQVLVLPTQ